jgi:hypothetical protein
MLRKTDGTTERCSRGTVLHAAGAFGRGRLHCGDPSFGVQHKGRLLDKHDQDARAGDPSKKSSMRDFYRHGKKIIAVARNYPYVYDPLFLERTLSEATFILLMFLRG